MHTIWVGIVQDLGRWIQPRPFWGVWWKNKVTIIAKLCIPVPIAAIHYPEEMASKGLTKSPILLCFFRKRIGFGGRFDDVLGRLPVWWRAYEGRNGWRRGGEKEDPGGEKRSLEFGERFSGHMRQSVRIISSSSTTIPIFSPFPSSPTSSCIEFSALDTLLASPIGL